MGYVVRAYLTSDDGHLVERLIEPLSNGSLPPGGNNPSETSTLRNDRYFPAGQVLARNGPERSVYRCLLSAVERTRHAGGATSGLDPGCVKT
jgi:hypothetical protein